MPDQVSQETTAVRNAHRFDTAALERYLEKHVKDFAGPLEVRQFAGGQSNPTFFLSAGGKEYVLRKKPPGKLLPSAHAVEREYRIIKALEETDVPVPHVHCLCEDESVIGTPFYVMDLVRGRIFRESRMPDVETPEERRTIWSAMGKTLAALHNVDYKAVGLGDFGKTGDYMGRQIGRWSKQYEASKTHEVESMNRLLQWLPAHIPQNDETTIAHGDFRLENMIVHPSEPRILAVLDWELSTLGHPLADLAYNCMLYHLPYNAKGGLGASNGFVGLDLKALGIPGEEEYVACYCEQTGRGEIPQFDFFLAFSMFRLAAIVQGVYKRGIDGNASSETATHYKPVVEFLADAAWKQVAHRA